jgi:hypothetical protein
MQTHPINTDERCEACRHRTGEHLVASDRQLGTEQRERFGMRLIVCSECLPKVTEAVSYEVPYEQ